jgi:hypothetical protein
MQAAWRCSEPQREEGPDLQFPEPGTSITLQPVGGKPSVSVAPFSPTQDQVDCVFVVEAASIDEAVQIASLHPSAHPGQIFGGGIEIRPCELYED